MLKFQNYRHYKLPITMNPLEYGKLIEQFENKYTIQVNKTDIALITQDALFNLVKFYKEGDLIYEYKDYKLSHNSFIRSLGNRKFTYENGQLIEINKIIVQIILFILFILLINIDNTSILIASTNIIKLRKVASKYNWENIIFNINNKVFSKVLFEAVFSNFWRKIECKFTENNHMFLLLKIKYNNGEILTIGSLQRINKNDKIWYLNLILGTIKIKSEYYSETQISSIIFDYGFKDEKIEDKVNLINQVNYQKYKNLNLPISMNPLDYNVLSGLKGISYIFRVFEKYNEVEIIHNGVSIVKYTDHKINEKAFSRKIGNKVYYFENNKQILFTKEIKTKFISKLEKSKNLTNNFITLDIETFVHENSLVPYLICYYDGKNIYSFSLWDYENVEMMILDCLKSIFTRKYNGFSVYMHNMAKFDIIFLLKYIVKIADVQPVIHNSRIIFLKINFGKDLEYRLQFKDSYLILLDSLSKLTKGFGVETQKSIFPFLFVNENNLDYIGKVPEFKYFNNKISLVEYKEYKNKFNGNWNLRNEAIKYCEIDCISLYQVIFKFSDLIFGLFKLNIHKYPTLPSLAFGIFISTFMKEENIPQLSGKIAKDIREGYTGGAVDMYIPRPPKGVEIKAYDVNSLYPKQMFDKLMPIGFPTYFEGNIRAIDPNAFGFFYCNIIAPDNLEHPILQTHVKINNMTRTIAPIGTWSDMLFSMEMDNAMKLGYKFKILWGYKFDKGEIFKDYVDFLYNIRLQYPKSQPLNYIAKILLNSLYGRFGMDDNFQNINIIHKDYLADFENKFFDQIEEKMDLGDHVLLFHKKLDSTKEDNTTHNVSIAVASSITAYSRIHMSQFKNNPSINLYYTDTDSIYTDSDLDESFIDNKVLGKLKLENIGSKAIFLAPKVYCLLTKDGEFIHKVKGLNHEIDLTFKDFENLLNKDLKIEKTQVKWKRSLNEGKINILEQLYTLKVTENKRKLIYKNSKLVGTKAYKIASDKTILK